MSDRGPYPSTFPGDGWRAPGPPAPGLAPCSWPAADSRCLEISRALSAVVPGRLPRSTGSAGL